MIRDFARNPHKNGPLDCEECPECPTKCCMDGLFMGRVPNPCTARSLVCLRSILLSF